MRRLKGHCKLAMGTIIELLRCGQCASFSDICSFVGIAMSATHAFDYSDKLDGTLSATRSLTGKHHVKGVK